MFKKILFPTSGSPLCGKIARTICGLIKEKPEREVTILNVLDPRHHIPAQVDYELDKCGLRPDAEAIKNAEQVLKKAIKVFKENNVPYKVMVRSGEPVCTIIEVADEMQCDLMVVGHHGESRLSDYLFKGNITARLINEADCPVIVIK
ncbi:nucleotide-binding universal stress UspA family protein [Desulfitispora alkaliphila]|uniref:universal stress protein n=1 Tax=Desulfitispora alkaliphila TaxID=622674 RepID=UPI003D1A0DF0